MRYVLTLLLAAVSSCLSAYSQCGATAAHGTVNVLIANPNGIVIVTDSKLSSDGRTVGFGQKLLRIDDSSYVAVAGQYCDSGPDFGDHHYLVAQAQLVPAMIETYLHAAPFSIGTSIEQKARMLARVVEFGLELTARLNRVLKRPISHSSTEVTIAGYEKGESKIVQMVIGADGDGNFSVSIQCSKNGSKDLEFCIGGIKPKADEVMSRPEDFSGDPLIDAWRDATLKNRGATFGLDAMRSLALDAMHRSTFTYQREIGGPQQIATLSAGRTVEFSQPVETKYNFEAAHFNILSGPVFVDQPSMPPAPGAKWISDLGFPLGSRGGDKYLGLFVSDAHVKNALQVLDRVLLTSSTFENCELLYNGSALAFFDKSNRLINTRILRLGPNAHFNDSFVQRMREDFPELTIVKDPPGMGIYGRDGKPVPTD